MGIGDPYARESERLCEASEGETVFEGLPWQDPDVKFHRVSLRNVDPRLAARDQFHSRRLTVSVDGSVTIEAES
jgi:hypothetical protein